jgi:hypothetical protein
MGRQLPKPVICVELWKEYQSVREAGRQHNIDNSAIAEVCNHKIRYNGDRPYHVKTAGGYHWIYKEDIDKLDSNL